MVSTVYDIKLVKVCSFERNGRKCLLWAFIFCSILQNLNMYIMAYNVTVEKFVVEFLFVM